MTYHKIQTIYKRDPATNNKTLLKGEFSQPEFEYLKDNQWVGTEKIDGTNIRVIWDGENVSFAGKSDQAMIPPMLLKHLQDHFTVGRLSSVLDGAFTLYGEGYGNKILKNGARYLPDTNSFILFDVYSQPPIDDPSMWLQRGSVESIALKLDCPVVPIITTGTLACAVGLVINGFSSYVAEDVSLPAEGLVLRPLVELLNREGERVITKIKCKDFRV